MQAHSSKRFRKGLLRVSFVAVGSGCRGALRNSFSLSVSFAWAKKTPFSRIKNFISRKRCELHSKPFLRIKTSFARAFLRCSQKIPIFTNQKPFFAQTFTNCPQKPPFLRTKSLLFAQTFTCCYPKQLFSPLRLPFQHPLTYCPQKNTAVLLISALTPFAVKPECRTDSNHCRRYPENLRFSV